MLRGRFHKHYRKYLNFHVYKFMNMVNNVKLGLAFFTLIVILCFIHRTSAAPLELSYDDGEFDYGWSNFYPYAAAVRFSSPSTSWKIEAIRVQGVCFLKGSSIFYVQI